MDSLPPIGSFDLISRLVRNYTKVTVEAKKEKNKLNLDSLRLFPGTKISKNATLSKDKVAWEERRSRSMAAWGTEATTKKNTLFRPKGIRDMDGTTGRFHTSTKPWLEKYETENGVAPKVHRMAATFGQAMFNFKRTLPVTSHKEEANQFIRQKHNPLSPMKAVGASGSMSKNMF